MRMLGLQGAVRGRRCRTTFGDDRAERPLDHLNRQFQASRPNELWVADFTYVATWTGFVYVAFVIDVFARRIIGWRVARSMQTELVLDALEQALWARSGTKGVVHHSDRGCQYLSIRYSERLAEAGVEPSVGNVGDSYDNALAETIIGLYKTEVIHHRGRGGMSMPSSTRPWNGSSGSITAGCSSRLATCHQRNSRRRTISQQASCRWQPDSNPELSGKAGRFRSSQRRCALS